MRSCVETGVFCFFAVMLTTLISCAAASDVKVEQQEISVTLVPERQMVMGETTMVLSGADDGGRLKLLLSPNATIQIVTISGKKLPYSFDQGVLAIDLQKGQHEKGSVTVVYQAVFKDPVQERPVNQEDPTFGVTGAITRQGVFLGGDAGWYPVPLNSPKRRISSISAPAGTEAITSGKRFSRKTDQGISRSTWIEEKPIGNLSLSAGPYRVEERRVAGIDLYTYFYPDNAHLSATYIEAAAKYIQFYNELLGPYSFEKFAIVENFFPTGYGFPSYTLLGSAIIRLPFIIDTSLPHEIVHNWWGNGVLADYREGNWSEGLATYLADYLLKEKKADNQGREARLQFLSDYATLVQPEKDFPLREFSGRVDPASRSIGYNKGAMVFHMLRQMLGDHEFFGALKDVYQEKLFKTASWNDFTKAFSRRAGKDLTPLMEQWLNRPGGPRIALSNVGYRRKGTGWEITGTIVQQPPFYKLALPLRVETETGMVEQSLPVSGERTDFKLTTPTPPDRLVLDPDVNLFRILSTSDLPATVNRIKGSPNLQVINTQNCKASKETLQLLLESLGQSSAHPVDEGKVDVTSLSRKDLLFCGIPQQPDLAGFPQEKIKVSPDEFRVSKDIYRQPDDLLFLVMARPTEHVSALFLPLSDDAAQKYALKITHYGKYSYLVFSKGENHLKGIFPAESGTSSFNFKKRQMP